MFPNYTSTQYPRFEYFSGYSSTKRKNQWYWRLCDGNKQTVAIGGEGYDDEYGVKRAIQNVIVTMPNAAPRIVKL